ncbi:hypothetical protein [Paraburkholderia aromaticivorans]|uniref:hypothetical protein n=1 Tax=Paraburkholderia aromaticivorans TaxID=2026199 RepID=UPI001455E4C8|nr:hypothetical protein [Paraburkholderia aromaticivorans]
MTASQEESPPFPRERQSVTTEGGEDVKLYFLALLVQALIERELPLAMKRENLDELALYPEQRQCARPTTEQIMRLFSLAQRHRLIEGAHTVQVFDVPLTELQRQLLRLLGVPEDAFRPPDYR